MCQSRASGTKNDPWQTVHFNAAGGTEGSPLRLVGDDQARGIDEVPRHARRADPDLHDVLRQKTRYEQVLLFLQLHNDQTRSISFLVIIPHHLHQRHQDLDDLTR